MSVSSPLLLYVPTLHKELLSFTPPGVRFMYPGLPGALERDEDWFYPASYPFSPDEARAALRDMLAFGELHEGGNAGAVGIDTQLRSVMDSRERAQVEEFSERGRQNATAGGGRMEAVLLERQNLVSAQTALLLAWDLEERLLELSALHAEVAAARVKLAASLGSGDVDEKDAAVLALPVPEPLAAPSWQLTLAALAAFIPENATLVSCHPGMREYLLENGMLTPLPEDTAERLEGWTSPVLSTTLWASLPLWRILGYSRPPEQRPWLLAAPELLLCPAHGGRHV